MKREKLKLSKHGQWSLDKADYNPSPRKPVNTLPAGWSADTNTGALHHSTHGIINTVPNPKGGYDIKHGGRPVGTVGDISEAGQKIRSYISTLQPMDTGMHNLDPMAMGKGDEHADLACAEEDKEKKDA